MILDVKSSLPPRQMQLLLAVTQEFGVGPDSFLNCFVYSELSVGADLQPFRLTFGIFPPFIFCFFTDNSSRNATQPAKSRNSRTSLLGFSLCYPESIFILPWLQFFRWSLRTNELDCCLP